MSDIVKDKDVSCFTVDGVVAEMVIEVEENQKTGIDDFKDSSNSPSKDHTKKNDGPDNVSIHEEISEKKDDSVEVIETEDKNVEHTEANVSDKINTEDKTPVKIVDDKTSEIKDCTVDDKISDESHDQCIDNKESDKIGDASVEDKKSDKMNSQNIKDSLNWKRKRKHEETANSGESDKEADMPRYPGRKRLANKRYISEDMITPIPKHIISESVDNKDNPKEIKKRKIEMDSKMKEESKDDSNDVTRKKSIQNKVHEISHTDESASLKGSDKSNLSRSKRNKKTDMENENSDSKQNVLRKLPFRKNKNAPDVPDLKPKVILWNGVGEGQGVKLGDIQEIRERIESAKSIRALYRVLFFQWPTNGQDIIGQILQFNGFPFDKSSYEFTKRQSLMKIMLDKTIFHMCELLDIRKGDKSTSISNILDFLLRPYAKIDPAQDPSLQPVVLLERLDLDDTFYDQSLSNTKLKRGRKVSSKNLKEINIESTKVTSGRPTRSSASKIEIVLSPEPRRAGEKSKDDVKSNKKDSPVSKETNRSKIKSSTQYAKGKLSATKDTKIKSVPGKKDPKSTSETKEAQIKETSSKRDIKTKSASVAKDDKSKTSSVKEIEEKPVSTKKDIKSPSKEEKSETVEIKNNQGNRRKNLKKRRKSNASSNKKVLEKKETSFSESKEDSDEYEIEMTVDSGPDIDNDNEIKDDDAAKSESKTEVKKDVETSEKTPKTVSTVTLSDSSETESAEETKLITASKKTPKPTMKRKGKPLRNFPKISDSIQNACFSALQRLHILLFGASDKAENLKTNILSFGGFPFLEGSDEWKQKHFLLSLLAQNHLREYLNLLCIPYANDDQPTMINKLMRFLAAPSEEALEVGYKIQPIETEVVSSVLVDKSSPLKGKVEIKKRVKKKEEKKPSKRPRKVLMSEEEARRLEASFAREQRAIAREKKVTPYAPVASIPTVTSVNMLPFTNILPKPPTKLSTVKPPQADPEQLNALIQTVYKRRALKNAGAVISTPNKGVTTKLGDIENIKFLIVTSNISDLEVLHRLIFMLEASKARIRKNILDFEGFGFNEDSPKYKHRMDYLNSLGYEASKRISFLLGLCPLNTNLPQQDLNELIMYFLMSPCKTKQAVPITQMPISQMPTDETHIIVKSTGPLENPVYIQNASMGTAAPRSTNSEIVETSREINIQHSTPKPKTGTQKARKTFPSSLKVSPVKKILLPPSQSPVLGAASQGHKMTLLNSVPAVPAFSIPKSTMPNPPSNVTLLNTGGLVLNAPKSPVNSLVKVPVNPGTKVQILNQGPKVAVIDPATTKIPVTTLSNIPGQVLQNQILIPAISNKNNMQSSQVQTPMVHGSKMVLKSPAGVPSPQEFLVQQQTPDGQQKTFKLIRLPANHPLITNAGNKQSVQPAVSSSPQLPQQVILTSTPLPGTIPPGFVIMKSNANLPSLPVLSNAPVKILPHSTPSSSVSSSQSKTTQPQAAEQVSSAEKKSVSLSGNSSDNSVELASSLEDNPPTDEDLFSSIQEIILSSNFEDITLRNVIEKVAAQYPNHDLTHRHNYMKECVKKIIIGT